MSNNAMGKDEVGGSNFQCGASTARRSRIYRFAWLFIGCYLATVSQVVGSIPVPNGDESTSSTGTGLRKLVVDYLAGSGTAYNNVISTYGHIQNWDTSQVTNMKYLFFQLNSGNQKNADISKWNTSAVTTMFGSKSFAILSCFFSLCQLMCFYLCFYCAVFQFNSAFNSDISSWKTGAVTSMSTSKSFTIVCCLFILCQLILFVVVVVVVGSILIFFYLFNSLPHVQSTSTLFCVSTSAFIV
jgi:surface protein